MTIRYFWLHSDGKTVKEIDQKQWRDLMNKDCESESHSRLLCKIYESRGKAELFLRKGKHFIWVPLAQLRKVLGDE